MNAEVRPPAWCIEVIERFRHTEAHRPELVAELATRLAHSGSVLPLDRRAADVASTGGPASLTTFIPPLILAARGTKVPKIGVPGRPAGVVDSFGAIDGYQTELTAAEFRRVLDEVGFASTLAANEFAPDDGLLFRARQRLGAQQNPALVVASLLAKKLAGGLCRVVFDVRVMKGGNFGEDEVTALRNISLMEQSAALLGIEAVCVISIGDAPAQPMLGRAEALRGVLSLLNGVAAPWLDRHYADCVRLASLADDSDDAQPGREALRHVLHSHLTAQGGGGLQGLEAHVERVSREHRFGVLRASEAGRLVWRMDRLRAAIVAGQGSPSGGGGGFGDDCGVELLEPSGAEVPAGASIALVRAASADVLHQLLRELESAVGTDATTKS